MNTPAAVAQWQARFDAAYPDGMLMTWVNEFDSPVYRIPRILVVGAVEGQPVVSLDVFDAQKNFSFLVAGYQLLRHSPTLARVVGDRFFKPMYWSGDVPLLLAQAMRRDREEDDE